MIDLFEKNCPCTATAALGAVAAAEGVTGSETGGSIMSTVTGGAGIGPEESANSPVDSPIENTTTKSSNGETGTMPTTTITPPKGKPCPFNYCDSDCSDGLIGHGHHAPPSPHCWTELSSRVFYGDQTELAGNGVLTESQMRDLQNYSFGVGHNGFDGRLLSEAILSSGRTDHALQLMAYHPDYLEIFLQTHHFLLRGDGPLPYNYRHYIAIMAAARYQCSYLMDIQRKEFLYQGGDPNWLRGIDSSTQKLKSLYDINKIMAHRPWILKKEDFISLTKKAGWSISEIVHAVVLLAHFHALSSFIHGCGITTPSPDNLSPGGTNDPNSTIMDSSSNSSNKDPLSLNLDSSGPAPDHHQQQPQLSTDSISAINSAYFSKAARETGSPINGKPSLRPAATNNINNNVSSPTQSPRLNKKGTSEVELLMAKMKNLSEMDPIEDPEERQKRFETVASSDDTHEKENRLSITSSSLPPDVSPFVLDTEFRYEDFAKRGQVNEMHTFRIQDYSWEEHGFSLINRLYADIGGYLDDKFRIAQNMTYNTMGGNIHVDTTKFRTAVWNYIQCLYGIRHDDYDYGEVNQLLERPLKSYIKKVCCFPERITKADRDSVMKEFKYSEKVHVNLMIMEAKIQAELLYALRTIMRFFL